MATDIIARGMAANAKKSVTELGNKVESEKWIGTKAEWEAVDKSTIKDGTIVYITDDKTVILYDKAEMEKIAAQVATDRKAAETAAQTAQAVADSLPDDYTTAVGKIAENTAEISAVKLSEKELQRRVNALYDIGQGITHRFETDSSTAYAKTIPTGGKLMSVKSVGGRSIVFNQLVDSNIVIIETTKYSFNGQHLTTNITDGLSLSDDLCALPTIPVGHKVLLKIKFIAGNVGNKTVTIGGYHKTANTSWQCKIDLPRNTELAGKTLIAMDTTTDTAENIRLFLFNSTIPLLTNIDCYINYYDLTTMFGAGNEPNTVEEFEKIFPADYYPYNAGEIISAGTEEVVEQGKNLLNADDYYAAYKQSDGSYLNNSSDFAGINIPIGNYIGKTLIATLKATVSSQPTSFFWAARINGVKVESSYEKGERVLANTTGIAKLAVTPKTQNDTLAMSFGQGRGDVIVRDIQVELGDTPTAYAPFHRNVYQIPEVIKALPGYGVEGNVTDYEAKTYTQNNTVDGTGIKALDTPIITDISSLIPDDFLRNIEVEAGGSITFKNSNGGSYRIPVPSEEEYIVKLSEVGGTT